MSYKYPNFIYFLQLKPESLKKYINKLKKLIKVSLPGIEAQYLMAPLKRAKYDEYKSKIQNAVKSAVCICLFEKDAELYLILIERHEYKGAHSGQICFPGGKPEVQDQNLQITAYREFEEETGFSTKDLELIGELTPLYIPASNFLVFPYLTFSNKYPNFNPSEREVKSILLLPIEKLLDDNIVKTTKMTLFNGTQSDVPYFEIENKIVWGATAMILSELKHLLKN